ncbi:MAG: hypothetical protein EOO50_02620 [Flavobacterium sp.]|uniref:hypothetical protein n=1 Tax=Flavobacterium sp. TaxID=239 RepID=UPI001219B2F5|nr:hypothetical protein [Flavobacterium sp.]RZJ68332.1 MAG: hypothetical protein EOO50_02620 [Flavobacterium sp.]
MAYDKGEFTDGWRYLEVHPVSLHYDLSLGEGAKWDEEDVDFQITTSAMGQGMGNTLVIVSNVPSANCAAKLCNDFTLNGYSDWFLPSSDEAVAVANSLLGIDINLQTCWTSTHVWNTAYAISFLAAAEPYFLVLPNTSKNSYRKVYPVRKY